MFIWQKLVCGPVLRTRQVEKQDVYYLNITSADAQNATWYATPICCPCSCLLLTRESVSVVVVSDRLRLPHRRVHYVMSVSRPRYKRCSTHPQSTWYQTDWGKSIPKRVDNKLPITCERHSKKGSTSTGTGNWSFSKKSWKITWLRHKKFMCTKVKFVWQYIRARFKVCRSHDSCNRHIAKCVTYKL